MKGLLILLLVAAAPAFAHHEVAASAAVVPLAGACAAFALAIWAGWRKRVKSRK